MANGYNPYNIVGTQQGLLENLLQSEQQKKQSEMAGGVHRGEMGEKFQKEQIAAQKEQERLLQEQRKPGFLEKLAPMLGLIPGVGSIAGATLGGLTGMYRAKQQSKHAQQQIGKARGAGLDSKWGGTFLGGQAREHGAKQDTMFDKMLEQTKISGGDLLKTGLTEGIKGYAMGKMGEGVGEAFGGNLDAAAEQQGYSIDPTYGALNLADLDKGFFEKLMKGLGSTDSSKLLEEGGEGSNILKNLLMMLAQQGGR